jgi:hypothetical protein
MLRFALLAVPPALAPFTPTLMSYEASFAAALSLDGVIPPPLTAGPDVPEPAPLNAWQPSLADSCDDDTSEAAIATVEQCLREVVAATPELGFMARETLHARLLSTARWVLAHHDPDKGPIERFANAQLYRVRRQFLNRHGPRRLWLELRDERERDAALHFPAAREAYLASWYKRIGKLQRKLSWHVPGFSGEDVAGALLALLIEAVDSGDESAFIVGGAPGIEGTFSFLVKKKRWLQRRQQIREIAPRDVLGSIGERPPTGEEKVLAREQRMLADVALACAEERLRPRQRRYFKAIVEDALEHEYLSEVRVAKRLGVHKSSVSRAVKVVMKALTRSGAAEVLDGHRPSAPRAKRRLWRTDSAPAPPKPRALPVVRRPLAVRKPPSAPQPPWLDEGDLVRIRDTDELGHVVSVDHCLVGPLYRVCCGEVERGDLPRDALEYLAPVVVPF